MGIEQVGVEAIVAGMAPFRANANEYVNRVGVMTNATKRASQETSALGQIAIGALRKIGALAIDGFLFAAKQGLRFVESVLSATVKGTAFARTLEEMRVHLLGVAKTELNPLFQQLDGLLQRARPALEALTQFAARTFTTLASNAAVWGENIVNQLAQGMWNAVGAVLDVLTSIASQIAGLLQPGSPPKILPDLDDWGTAAMQVYLDGWGKANFDTFDTLAGTLESHLRSLAGRDDTNLIPRILGTREAIAQAVDQVRRSGQVTEATLQGIYAAAGATTIGLQKYVKSVFDLELADANVTAAQAELNRVTKQYQDLLRPIDKQLEGITEAQQQLTEDQELRRLQLIQDDPGALASEKEQARLKAEQILAERRRRALLAEQAGAVDAAQTKLEAAQTEQQAAQDQFDAQQDAIDLATQQNNLLKEQLDLLKRLSAAAAGGAEKKGGATGIIQPVTSGFDISKFVPDGIAEKWAAFQTAWSAAWAAIVTTMQPAVDAWNNDVKPAWDRLVASFVDSLPDIEASIARMVAFAVQSLGISLPGVFDNLGRSLDSLANMWRDHHNTVLAIVEGLFKVIWTTISVTLVIISGIIALALRVIEGAFKGWSLALQGDWEGVWENAKATLSDAWDIIKGTVRTALDTILLIVGQNTDTFLATWTTNWENAKTIISTTWENIKKAVSDKIFEITGDLQAWIIDIINTFQTTDWGAVGQGLIDGIAAGITGAISGLAAAAASAAAGALQAAKDALGISSPSKLAAKLVGEPFALGIAKGIMDALPAVTGAVQMATGAMVPAPAVSGRGDYSYTDARQFNYNAGYSSAPPNPQMDVAIMRVFWER